jgi:hypothetical protein
MAGIPSTYLIGFGTAGTNREDLIDMITNIDPWETPLFVACPKTQATHVTHEWLTDTLAATSTAGATEGSDFNETFTSAPTRLQNICHIFRKDFKVTNTQRAVNPAGANDWYNYEVQKALKEIARNVETKLLAQSGSCVTGSTAVARVMKSISDFLTTNVESANSTLWGLKDTEGSAASATFMNEDTFNEILERIFNSGGNPDSAYVSAAVKRQISAFSGQGASRRNIAMAEKKLIASVDMYDSDTGLINIVLDRWCYQPATTSIDHTDLNGNAFFLETPMIRIPMLRPIRHVPLPPVGDATRGMVLGELTVEVLNEKSCGKYWGTASITS